MTNVKKINIISGEQTKTFDPGSGNKIGRTKTFRIAREMFGFQLKTMNVVID